MVILGVVSRMSNKKPRMIRGFLLAFHRCLAACITLAAERSVSQGCGKALTIRKAFTMETINKTQRTLPTGMRHSEFVGSTSAIFFVEALLGAVQLFLVDTGHERAATDTAPCGRSQMLPHSILHLLRRRSPTVHERLKLCLEIGRVLEHTERNRLHGRNDFIDREIVLCLLVDNQSVTITRRIQRRRLAIRREFADLIQNSDPDRPPLGFRPDFAFLDGHNEVCSQYWLDLPDGLRQAVLRGGIVAGSVQRPQVVIMFADRAVTLPSAINELLGAANWLAANYSDVVLSECQRCGK